MQLKCCPVLTISVRSSIDCAPAAQLRLPLTEAGWKSADLAACLNQDVGSVGGMRSGAACKRKQFSGHSAVRCRAVGLKHRP